MKLKKTLFSVEIEIETREIEDLLNRLHPDFGLGFLFWLKKNFGLGLFRSQPMEEKHD